MLYMYILHSWKQTKKNEVKYQFMLQVFLKNKQENKSNLRFFVGNYAILY